MSESVLLNPDAHRQNKQGKGLALLLVDPQPESRALLKAAVRSVEMVQNVRETSNAKNILPILSDQKIDIILIEQNWDDVDVFEEVKRIKADSRYAGLRFILMSSHLDMESRRKGIEAGILGYLSKPFDINNLERAIKDSMGKVSTNHKETLNKVRRIEFFSEFSDLELVRLLKICHTRKFSIQELIFSEGENGDRLYVLIMGQVEIVKKRPDGEYQQLVVLNPGDVFGEMAIVDQEPRSADARALSNAMIIELNAQIINNINDILALKLFRKIAILVTKRLRTYTTQRVSQS
ncbi:MAG: cyclic nucleotide-binding domain-containing protein [Deltaproteobacteria bacterium]|nr:cyclic nucleotide-binding domain-containing protein [Deltaproteobacteria bacterium]